MGLGECSVCHEDSWDCDCLNLAYCEAEIETRGEPIQVVARRFAEVGLAFGLDADDMAESDDLFEISWGIACFELLPQEIEFVKSEVPRRLAELVSEFRLSELEQSHARGVLRSRLIDELKSKRKK